MNQKIFKFAEIFVVLLILAVIFYLNYQLIFYWFGGDFNKNIASIETSYIQMAKFWDAGSLWQGRWYLGYPWHVFYTPVLPFLELLLHKIAGFEFAHAYRVLTGIGFILVPI